MVADPGHVEPAMILDLPTSPVLDLDQTPRIDGQAAREPWPDAQDELDEQGVATAATMLAGVKAMGATWPLPDAWPDAWPEPGGQADDDQNDRLAWHLGRSLTERSD